MPLYDGPVVDSHHHLFWNLTENYPWMSQRMRPMIFGDDWSVLKREYSIDDLKADFATHNVVKSVHVQANFDIARPVDETAGLQGFAEHRGSHFSNLTPISLMVKSQCSIPSTPG